jgi:hypothetical protein
MREVNKRDLNSKPLGKTRKTTCHARADPAFHGLRVTPASAVDDDERSGAEIKHQYFGIRAVVQP